MSPTKTGMPCSTIKHRPIFATPQVTPLVMRASTISIADMLPPGAGKREQHSVQWHISFCIGMTITLAILLFGHFVG